MLWQAQTTAQKRMFENQSKAFVLQLMCLGLDTRQGHPSWIWVETEEHRGWHAEKLNILSPIFRGFCSRKLLAEKLVVNR